jgi:hypothetical protein
MAGQVQKQPAPKRSPWAPEKSKREQGTLERDEPKQKNKEKPKVAPAGGGAKPPSKPPKGFNKGPKDEGKKDYGFKKSNKKG